MAGIEGIPLRVPQQWDPKWFEQFVREVLANADVRNAQGQGGVSITGASSEAATISAIAGEIITQPVVVVALSGDLSNERQLSGATGEVSLTDNGANNTLEIGITAIAQAKVTNLTTDLAGKVDTSTALTAGSGLTGGGDLSANRTFDIGAGDGVSVAADSVAVDTTFDFSWTGDHDFSTPPVVPSYTVAGVPSAATYARGIIYVSDEAGGAVLAFSDGTNWRRVTDRAIVS